LAAFAAPPRQAASSNRQERLMERFDTNRDGQLDEAERAAARAAWEARRQAAGDKSSGLKPQRFRERPAVAADSKRAAALDPAERAAREATLRQELEQRPRFMQRYDTDGDGRLSDAEWAAAREARRAAREGARNELRSGE
jgi:hypothetical protein